jgi:hypothetical protein
MIKNYFIFSRPLDKTLVLIQSEYANWKSQQRLDALQRAAKKHAPGQKENGESLCQWERAHRSLW